MGGHTTQDLLLFGDDNVGKMHFSHLDRNTCLRSKELASGYHDQST